MKKIILDCDPGMDDSMAIIMAAKAPQLELLAVTRCLETISLRMICVRCLTRRWSAA